MLLICDKYGSDETRLIASSILSALTLTVSRVVKSGMKPAIIYTIHGALSSSLSFERLIIELTL
jgi:hypothetical protein